MFLKQPTLQFSLKHGVKGETVSSLNMFSLHPPSNSNWFKSDKSFNFEKLKDEMAFYERQSPVILIGDYNARVGLHKDYIVYDNIDEVLTLPENYIPDNEELIPKRKSCDDEFDSRMHANDFLNFCKMSSYRIPNGRLGKDRKQGNFTCYKPNCNSIVDYMLVKEKDFDKISDFKIGELNEYSDHSYLTFKIKSISKAVQDVSREGTSGGVALPER